MHELTSTKAESEAEEIASGPADWARLPDPFPEWVDTSGAGGTDDGPFENSSFDEGVREGAEPDAAA